MNDGEDGKNDSGGVMQVNGTPGPKRLLGGSTSSPKRLSQKQDNLCLRYIETGNLVRAAKEAGYASSTAQSHAWRILRMPAAVARIKELRDRISDDSVMLAHQRKVRLSEIANGSIADFLGDQNGEIRIAKDSINLRAIEQISVRSRTGQNGAEVFTITDIKLRDALRAIAELNRMESMPFDSQSAGNKGVVITEIEVVKSAWQAGAPGEMAAPQSSQERGGPG